MDFSPLHIACAKGFKKCASELLKNGADPNSRDIFGFTPLHLLLSKSKYDKKHYRALQCFIEYNIDLNSKDWLGSTVLHFAAAFQSHYQSYKKKILFQNKQKIPSSTSFFSSLRPK
eukprot:Anaeramoba_flamelloidesa812160_25.p1 GENE.a812160_25~~a812160_25.p1  ORF type:complete len:116 (+),score=12.43 a812160_25:2-349(+)